MYKICVRESPPFLLINFFICSMICKDIKKNWTNFCFNCLFLSANSKDIICTLWTNNISPKLRDIFHEMQSLFPIATKRTWQMSAALAYRRRRPLCGPWGAVVRSGPSWAVDCAYSHWTEGYTHWWQSPLHWAVPTTGPSPVCWSCYVWQCLWTFPPHSSREL